MRLVRRERGRAGQPRPFQAGALLVGLHVRGAGPAAHPERQPVAFLDHAGLTRSDRRAWPVGAPRHGPFVDHLLETLALDRARVDDRDESLTLRGLLRLGTRDPAADLPQPSAGHERRRHRDGYLLFGYLAVVD